MTTLGSFISTIKQNGVAKASHFFCDIVPPRFMIQTAGAYKDTIPFYVEGVNMPEFALATQEVQDAGLRREVVYNKMYGTVTMTFFADQNMMIKKFFDDWTMAPVMKKGGTFLYPESYTSENLAIFQMNAAKNATYMILLNNVYPKIVDDISFNASSKSPLSFRVQFTYESWDSYQFTLFDPNKPIPGTEYTNLRRAWNLAQLIRTGANKDAIKSSVINLGTRKVYDILNKSGLPDTVGKTVDGILGKTGIGSALGSLSGFGL